MSNLWVSINYNVAKTVINGMRGWLDKLEDLLDSAKVDHEKSAELNKNKNDGS